MESNSIKADVFNEVHQNMKTIEQIFQHLKEGSLKEDEFIELKTCVRNRNAFARILVGIANSGGGYLIIGVEETAHGCKIVGLKDNENFVGYFIKSICKEYNINIDTELTKGIIDGYKILIVKISTHNITTYYSHSTSPERLYAFERDKSGYTIQSKFSKLYQKIYKYMTLETFMLCLYTGKWRFFEPNKWQDKYERRFYCAEYHFPDADIFAPRLYATCVTRKKNSEAAWKVYAQGNGFGQHCVQFEINLVEFRKQLEASDLLVEEREVEYYDEGYIENLHQSTNKNYPIYFKPFTRRNFISLLSLKRDAYEYEKEVRFFLIPKNLEGQRSHGKQRCNYKDISIQWRKIIKSVRIDKHCSIAEVKSLQQACFAAGINPVMKNYDWIGNDQAHNAPPMDAVPIQFELFCIDDMKGSARLKIFGS